MVRELPKWKGYTIDERLQEFRRVRWVDGNPMMDIIPFASKEGMKLQYKRDIEKMRRVM
jgi:hypothetical protein